MLDPYPGHGVLLLLLCRAFCVEKNSAAPEVQFRGVEPKATLVVPYVEFVLTEVIKNALQVRRSTQQHPATSAAGAWRTQPC